MDAAAALRAVRAAFPDVREGRLRRLGEGWANVCYLGRTGLVYRFPKTDAARAALRRELALLPALAPALPLVVPAFRHAAPDASVAAYPLVPGVPLRALSPAQAGDVARLLAALHAFPAPGPAGATAATWRADLEAFWTSALAALDPWWPPADARHARSHIDAFMANGANFAFAPVLLHGDLVPEHLLADPGTGRLVGVIDFEDACVGDPALDFAGLGAVAPSVLAGYRGPADPGLLRRAAFYHSLAPLHEMLYGAATGRRARVRAGLAAWRRGLQSSGPPATTRPSR